MAPSSAAAGADLIQLIYVSSLVGPDESALPAILASAVRHNAEDGITGMLLYAHGSFLQVLEGPRAAVEATYARIARDPRHAGLTLLTEEVVPAREFAAWSMGFRHLRAEDAARFPAEAAWFRFGFDARAIQAAPGVALELLRGFAQRAR